MLRADPGGAEPRVDLGGSQVPRDDVAQFGHVDRVPGLGDHGLLGGAQLAPHVYVRLASDIGSGIRKTPHPVSR